MSTLTETRRDFPVTLMAVPSIVGYAREIADSHLVLWQLDAQVVDDVVIVVSELVTNAVNAKEGADIKLHLALLECHVLIEVWDSIPAMPEPKQPAPVSDGEEDDPGGRGLSMVVEGLCDFWGFRSEEAGPGKTVYALVRHAPPVVRDGTGQFKTTTP